MNTTIKTAPEPPRAVACLLSGFDTVSNHIGLILFPVALDLFLWLGPQIRVSQLLGGLLSELRRIPSFSSSTDDARLLEMAGTYWVELVERINLFATLRSYPVGVSSLIAASPPLQNPLGLPAGWELGSFAAALILWFVFNLLGIAAGTLYFSAISQAALHGKVDWKITLSRWPRTSFQIFILTLIWALILLAVAIPGSCMVSMISLLGLSLGQFLLYMFAGLAVWLLFPIIFSPHGIFYKQRLAWVSVRDSVRITRLTTPQTVLFFVMILLINEGLGFLWRLPGETSWMLLIGMLGHGFIASGLLAASFIYYRDAERWVNQLLIQARLSA